jgi:hypothetical protein
MSDFTRFMKENKKVKENAKYPASSAFTDDEGKTLEWEIKPLTTAENENIREECVKQTRDKNGRIKSELNTNLYILKVICASVVFPNLNDKKLQDSYGVMSPEELILSMIDNPGEYDEFGAFIMKYNGFNKSVNEDIEEAKN